MHGSTKYHGLDVASSWYSVAKSTIIHN